MALDKAALKAALVVAFTNEDYNTTIEQQAEKIANAIDAYVRAAVVTINAGIPVTTAASTGSTTAPGTGGLS